MFISNWRSRQIALCSFNFQENLSKSAHIDNLCIFEQADKLNRRLRNSIDAGWRSSRFFGQRWRESELCRYKRREARVILVKQKLDFTKAELASDEPVTSIIVSVDEEATMKQLM